MSRQRWAYTRGGVPLPEPELVSTDFTTDARFAPLLTDRWREGSRATDGTDIGSRGREREYMQRNGLANLGDYTHSLERHQAKRADWLTGKAPPDKELRETVGRAHYELSKKGRR